MLKKSKIIIVFVLLVSFLMNSCHNEEELESIDTQTVIKKRNISFEELNTKLNKYKKYKVHHGRTSGDGFITSLETDNIVEFETEDKTTYTLKANTTADDTTSFTNIIFVEKNGELEKYLLRYEPTEAWKTARLTDANILYSGNTIILDFDGIVLAESQVIDGITVSKTSTSMICYVFEEHTDYFFETYYVLVEVPCDEPIDDEIDAGDSGDGGGTDVDTNGDGDGGNDTSGSGTDGDSSNDNGTGDTADTGDDGDPIFTEPVFGDNDGDIDLMAQLNALLCDPINVNQFNAADIETIQIILDYLQESSSGDCSEIDFDELVRIIDEMDKRCQAKIVADALYLNSTFTNMFFDSLIEPLDNHILFFDLPEGYDDDQIPENTGAETILMPVTIEGVSGQSMVINFNDNYLDTATDLSIFATTIHEMLHAYLYYLYHNDLLLNTYPQYTVLNEAITNLIQESSDINKENFSLEVHNVYIDFIDLLAQSVFQYAQDNDIEGVDFQYSKKLIWGGLFDPNNNDNIFTNNLTLEEQIEAMTIAINEHTNDTNAKGTKNCIND